MWGTKQRWRAAAASWRRRGLAALAEVPMSDPASFAGLHGGSCHAVHMSGGTR